MPLEISEIGIRMRVQSGTQGAGGGESGGSGPAAPGAAVDREALVQECVQRVLQALRTAQER